MIRVILVDRSIEVCVFVEPGREGGRFQRDGQSYSWMLCFAVRPHVSIMSIKLRCGGRYHTLNYIYLCNHQRNMKKKKPPKKRK